MSQQLRPLSARRGPGALRRREAKRWRRQFRAKESPIVERIAQATRWAWFTDLMNGPFTFTSKPISRPDPGA